MHARVVAVVLVVHRHERIFHFSPASIDCGSIKHTGTKSLDSSSSQKSHQYRCGDSRALTCHNSGVFRARSAGRGSERGSRRATARGSPRRTTAPGLGAAPALARGARAWPITQRLRERSRASLRRTVVFVVLSCPEPSPARRTRRKTPEC